MSDIHINRVDHPGSYVRRELEARNWSQNDLAYVLGCSIQSLNLLVNEKKGISADMAKALGKAFNISAEFFSNIQAMYDLSQASDPDEDIERRAKLQTYPLKSLVSRGWLEETKFVDLMEQQLCRFFKVPTLETLPNFAHAAKKTHYDDVPIEQLAWLFRVRKIAEEMVIPKYEPTNMNKLIEELKTLRNEPDQTRHVGRLLSEAGIRFVIVENLPKSTIDGACFWLSDKEPVIGMSLRYDRIDNFWFVLRHELEHVLKGHGKEKEIIDIGLEDQKSDSGLIIEEKIANEAGADFCVDTKKMDSFYLRKEPFISEKDVIAFAAIQKVHPGLVVGQIHKRSGKHSFLRKYLVSVRKYVSQGAIVDGWGDVIPVDN